MRDGTWFAIAYDSLTEYNHGYVESAADEMQFNFVESVGLTESQSKYWGTDHLEFTPSGSTATHAATTEYSVTTASVGMPAVNGSDSSDARTLYLQIKDDIAVGFLPKPTAADSKDHHFLFLKIEENIRGGHWARGVFLGKTDFGSASIVNDGGTIKLTLEYDMFAKSESFAVTDANNILRLVPDGGLVVFKVKFADLTKKFNLVRDPSLLLGLVNTKITTTRHCKSCWSKDDMSPYTDWDARQSYTEQAVWFRELDLPWVLNPSTSRCELQCRTGYWSNWESKQYPAADDYDQRCTSNNCKKWPWGTADSAKTGDTCDECWDHADITDYDNWDAKASYPIETVRYRLASKPFNLNADAECAL
jgi:hypothetical protein